MADIPLAEDTLEEIKNVSDNAPATDLDPETEESKSDIQQFDHEDADVFDTEDQLPCQPPPTLEDLANSVFIHNRQLAAKRILEDLQKAGSNQEKLQSVISVMCKFSEDEEAMVRSEFVQQIPSIALYCNSQSPHLKIVIRQQLVPYTVKLMNDRQISVCKWGQAALLVLLENNLIDQAQLSEWICPYVAQLAMCDTNLEELRIEDVTLMSQMIPLVSKEIALKFFLEPTVALCCDAGFSIRKVCAKSLGTLCKIAGTVKTELSLLPSFLNLCNDEVWGVRKACADVFVDVAQSVTEQTRRNVLPHMFINLLNDRSLYVRNAAYQALGGFICCFADYSKTGCVYKDGKLIVLDNKDILNSQSKPRLHCDDNLSSISLSSQTDSNCNQVFQLELADDLHHSGDTSFNNFQYWRLPLPEIELDNNTENQNEKTELINPSLHEDEACENDINVDKISLNKESFQSFVKETTQYDKPIQAACINTYCNLEGEDSLEDDTDVIKLKASFKESTLSFDDVSYFKQPSHNTIVPDRAELSSLSSKQTITSFDQDIVPCVLLHRFVSAVTQQSSVFDMQSGKQSEDEIIGYCAYSFPAVAFTLGRKYWPCIRNICDTLARNLKWTIRKIIASSLHELALILGPDIIVCDLLPIFLELLKDVDEVRLKLIEHLSDFLQHLDSCERRKFLPFIEQFSKVDNKKNWRFRLTVAEHLKPTSKLYSPSEIREYFMPITLILVRDRVSAVRLAAVELMATLVKQVSYDTNDKGFVKKLLDELDSSFREANKWIWRQTYVFISESFAKHNSISDELYMEEVIPRLFSLAYDDVPNVRIAVARCLSSSLLPLGFLSYIQDSRYQLLVQVMYSLQNDGDEDVKYFARLAKNPPKSFI